MTRDIGPEVGSSLYGLGIWILGLGVGGGIIAALQVKGQIFLFSGNLRPYRSSYFQRLEFRN